MKKLISTFLFSLILLPSFALAQGVPVREDCFNVTGIPVPCLGVAVGPAGKLTASGLIIEVISILLWVVGLLAVLYVIIGGIRYVTAHGNEEQAEGAKKTILHAIIGIIIVILSFVIIRIIANALILGALGA